VWSLYFLGVLSRSSSHMNYDDVPYILVSGFLGLVFVSECWRQWKKKDVFVSVGDITHCTYVHCFVR